MTIDLNSIGALTHPTVQQLIALASDKTHNQLRVTKAGVAFISSVHVGADNIQDLAFRLDTWSQGSDHVGPKAAQDQQWIDRVFKVLRDNWPNPTGDYIDQY